MKRILLISVLLVFVAAARPANAVTVENIVVTDTGGGVSVTGEARASGSSEADADVQSVIRTEGSNTRVRIDVSAESDGHAEATSTVQMTGLRNPSSDEGAIGTGRFEVRMAPESAEAREEMAAEISASSTSSTTSSISSVWTHFKASFARLYRLLFFWESR